MIEVPFPAMIEVPYSDDVVFETGIFSS